ncbi:unnamed protein product [Psylliodes chrysocephalus]|uniref:Peptidoglycan-recognition protein n=1 Tax=Psylliodes chrysocephalus TaxID=3402493 RepID=A0A9P0G9U2_9CUCU|nr:unnamed protein product [Psylliodes chrysocephala]
MDSFIQIVFLIFICALFESEATCPNIISREEWGAIRPTEKHLFLVRPVPFVVIHHSDTLGCNTTQQCKERIKKLQLQNMSILGSHLHDIRYHFMIGGDGNIYQGRGWDNKGAHVKTYNSRSIGISVMGHYENEPPSAAQMEALENLLKCGVQTKKIAPDYRLIAHRQANSQRNCPGEALFELIKKMHHWDPTLK